jgi:hypothetical protein
MKPYTKEMPEEYRRKVDEQAAKDEERSALYERLVLLALAESF